MMRVKVEAEVQVEAVRARDKDVVGRRDSAKSECRARCRKRSEKTAACLTRRAARQSRHRAMSATIKEEVMDVKKQTMRHDEAVKDAAPHQEGDHTAPNDGAGDDDVEIMEFTYDHTGKNLLVSNLHADVHFADLHRIFGRYGMVREIQMKEPTEFGHSHYAFVKFCSQHEARAAQRAVDQQVRLRGRTLRVIMCRPGTPYHVPMAPSLSASIAHHYLGVGAVSLEIAFIDHAALRHTALSFLQQLQGEKGRASHAPRNSTAAQPQRPAEGPPAVQSQYHSQRPVEGTVDMSAVVGRQELHVGDEQPERPDQLVCIVSGHVATLPDPIFGGCMQSTVTQLLQQQLRAPFTPTRALEVVGKLAYCNAAKDVFAQLRLVRVPGSGRWVPAMAPPPDHVIHNNIKAYLHAVQHADRSDVVIDPFVEASDDDDGAADGDDADVAGEQDIDTIKEEDQDVSRVDDIDTPVAS